MSGCLRVATINILKNSSRWEERRPLLAAGLCRLGPDLIAMQEVALADGRSNAHDLADDLGGYEVVVAARAGWWRRGEGVAVLSRLPILERTFIHLGGGEGRTAQFVRVEVAGRPLVLANGHYLWRPGADAARARQVEQVIDHWRKLPSETALVACGDFNATPASAAIATASRTLTSAHSVAHGCEPDFTCPTPLQSGHLIRDAVTSAVMRVCSNRSDGPWRATLDYIFVSPEVRIIDADVCLNEPASADPTLYPSDHFGIVATLDVKSISE